MVSPAPRPRLNFGRVQSVNVETSKTPGDANDFRWAPLRKEDGTGLAKSDDHPMGDVASKENVLNAHEAVSVGRKLDTEKRLGPNPGDPSEAGDPPGGGHGTSVGGRAEPTSQIRPERGPDAEEGSDDADSTLTNGAAKTDKPAQAGFQADAELQAGFQAEAETDEPLENSDTSEPKADAHPVFPTHPPSMVADPIVGVVIDSRYRILSKMATGGMASVYVARDQRLDRLVALKLMHPHLAESAEFVERFRREARSAARVSHPGVVPIFDQGVHQGQGYLVMELVEGPDLRSHLQVNGPITLAMAFDFLEQILSALAAAHRTGVIHRDLKPENVLVAPEQRLRIVDFGLARAVTEGTLSSTGSILGTVAYLAPEVAVKGTLDSRTDLYAVGIMAFELFTGDVPGDQSNPLLVAMSRVNEDIPAPSSVVDWLPSETDDLVAALTARDPALRPSSAAEAFTLVEKTRGLLAEEQLARELPAPIEATPPLATLPKTPDETDVLLTPAGTSVLPIEKNVVRTSGSVSMPTEMHTDNRAKRGWVIASILMLVAILGLGSWWWWAQYGPGAYVELPDLAGMPVEEAQNELTELGLASFATFENSDDIPVDTVIGTDPGAGQRAHRNAEVNVIVSKGILMVTVPNLQGMTEEAAIAALNDKGLEPGEIVEEWSQDFDEGLVLSSDPGPESSIPHNQPVQLTVSKGPEPITLPDWVGSAWTDVEAAARELGLAPQATEEHFDDVDEGLVASQDPAADSIVHRSDGVTFVVSLGPEMIEVPNVYGMGVDDATALLEEAGFAVEVKRLAGFFNSVGSQTPRGGQLAKRGSTVELTVV